MTKPGENTVVLITRAGMGHADPELQTKLIKTWLKVVEANGHLPEVVCLYADGVKLAVGDSPVLEELKRWEAVGVHLVLCKTCLDHFGLIDAVAVGTVGGMGDIVAAQLGAAKVITL
jgi:hypothetical protein